METQRRQQLQMLFRRRLCQNAYRCKRAGGAGMNSLDECTLVYPDDNDVPLSECLKCNLRKMEPSNPDACWFGNDHIKALRSQGCIQMELA
jgi:hypothetical protein